MKEGSAPSPEPKALPQLDYAAAPPRWQRRRRILFGPGLVALAFVASYWGPGFCRRALVLYWQRQCLNYTAPADQVVYEEEPKAAAKLMTLGPFYARRYPRTSFQISRGISLNGSPVPEVDRHPAVYTPVCWQRLGDCAPGTRSAFITSPGAVVFLHALRSSNGTRYLTEVEYFRDGFVVRWIAGLNYTTNTIIPGSFAHEPAQVLRAYAVSVKDDVMPTPPNTRIYAGQVDPADPSHFTIRYEMWGQTDVVDGYINDSGGITLKQRNPPRPPGRTDGPR